MVIVLNVIDGNIVAGHPFFSYHTYPGTIEVLCEIEKKYPSACVLTPYYTRGDNQGSGGGKGTYNETPLNAATREISEELLISCRSPLMMNLRIKTNSDNITRDRSISPKHSSADNMIPLCMSPTTPTGYVAKEGITTYVYESHVSNFAARVDTEHTTPHNKKNDNETLVVSFVVWGSFLECYQKIRTIKTGKYEWFNDQICGVSVVPVGLAIQMCSYANNTNRYQVFRFESGTDTVSFEDCPIIMPHNTIPYCAQLLKTTQLVTFSAAGVPRIAANDNNKQGNTAVCSRSLAESTLCTSIELYAPTKHSTSDEAPGSNSQITINFCDTNALSNSLKQKPSIPTVPPLVPPLPEAMALSQSQHNQNRTTHPDNSDNTYNTYHHTHEYPSTISTSEISQMIKELIGIPTNK
jgi:hypothetical protein